MLYTFIACSLGFSLLSIRPFQILRLCHVCDFYFHRSVRFVYIIRYLRSNGRTWGKKI